MGTLIQPSSNDGLGPARSIRDYLVGWATGDVGMDYELVGDELMP